MTALIRYTCESLAGTRTRLGTLIGVEAIRTEAMAKSGFVEIHTCNKDRKVDFLQEVSNDLTRPDVHLRTRGGKSSRYQTNVLPK